MLYLCLTVYISLDFKCGENSLSKSGKPEDIYKIYKLLHYKQSTNDQKSIKSTW